MGMGFTASSIAEPAPQLARHRTWHRPLSATVAPQHLPHRLVVFSTMLKYALKKVELRVALETTAVTQACFCFCRKRPQTIDFATVGDS